MKLGRWAAGSNRWKCLAVVLPMIGMWLLPSAQADDRRIWLQQGVETELGQKWMARLQQAFHLANESPHFTTYYTEASITHHTRRWLDLGGGFREQFERRDEDWLQENRPFANITFKWKWWEHAFSDRNQFEWRLREDRDTEIRYRNKLTVESPARWTSWGIHPYLADELFYDNESQTFLRNRVYAGLNARPLDWLSADLFAIWESKDTGVNAYDDVYIAGLKLTATL